jgi:hypothetical protein
MVQIPGIKYGVPDVVTLATLNGAIEDVLGDLRSAGVDSLEAQSEFLSQCLEAWLDATGRKEDVSESTTLDPENVAYQGRAIVTFLTLVPACIWELRKARVRLVSRDAQAMLQRWLNGVMKRARLLRNGRFLAKSDFKKKGYLGSGGLARFRDALWVAAGTAKTIPQVKPETLAKLAEESRARVRAQLGPRNEN